MCTAETKQDLLQYNKNNKREPQFRETKDMGREDNELMVFGGERERRKNSQDE